MDGGAKLGKRRGVKRGKEGVLEWVVKKERVIV